MVDSIVVFVADGGDDLAPIQVIVIRSALLAYPSSGLGCATHMCLWITYQGILNDSSSSH